MAYVTTLKFVTGDTLPVVNIQLKDAKRAADGMTLDEYDSDTWRPIDLTGASALLRVRALGSATTLKEITGTVVSATDGIAAFSFAGNSFDTSGNFEGEVEVTLPSGIHSVYDLLKFKVRDEFVDI